MTLHLTKLHSVSSSLSPPQLGLSKNATQNSPNGTMYAINALKSFQIPPKMLVACLTVMLAWLHDSMSSCGSAMQAAILLTILESVSLHLGVCVQRSFSGLSGRWYLDVHCMYKPFISGSVVFVIY